MQTAEEVAPAYGGSIVIPVSEVAKRHLSLGTLGLETEMWPSLVLLLLDVFRKKKEFFLTFWWLSSVPTIPFVSLFSHISRMNAFDALSSSSSSSRFLLNCSPQECHIETERGVDFHVVKMRVLWETALVCDSESAAGLS